LLIIGAAYYIITESEWIVSVVDWVNEKWGSFQRNKEGVKYSQDLKKGTEAVGDSDDDEKIITNTKGGTNEPVNQRKKGGDDLEGANTKEAPSENLIDINKYTDSGDEHEGNA